MAAHARARPSVVFPGLYGVIHTPDEIVDQVLVMEDELLTGRSGP